MVTRLVVALLVTLLSGVPAAAVVCDLLLCADPAPATSQGGCHDHAGSSSEQQITARLDDCTHMSSVDPYLTMGLRVLLPVAAAHASCLADRPIQVPRSVSGAFAHGPPPARGVVVPLPLRI